MTVLYSRRVSQPDPPSVRPPARTTRLPRSEKVASRVAREIVRGIVDLDLDPGDPLEPEAQMLERYGVSRGSLREALRILETQGLISIKPGPGGGPSFAPVSSGDFGRMATLFFQVMGVRLGDVLEARLVLEPVMAGLAAVRRDPAEHAALQANVAEHDEGLPDAEWLRVTQDFHALVCGMSGNPLLNLLALALKDIYTDRVSGFVFGVEKRAYVREVHGGIAGAILAGDAATAERLMREHMDALAHHFEERYPGLMDELVDWG